MDKHVSIILPTYNRAHLIERSIRSVLEQTYSEFELIVVDDASTDDTREVIAAFGDPRIRYIALERNRGAAGARNEGVRQAQCPYIAFQDSDDVWHTDKLEKQMLAMEQAEQEVAIIYSKYYYHSYNQAYDGYGPTEEIYERNKSGYIFPYLLLQNLVALPTVLAKREVFAECGMFREDWKCLEDYEWILRVAGVYQMRFLNEILLEVYATLECVSNQVGPYFKSRCALYQMYKQELVQYRLEEYVYQDITNRAKEVGCEQEVLEMLGVIE